MEVAWQPMRGQLSTRNDRGKGFCAGRSRRSSRESLAGSETSRQRSIAAPVAGGRVGGEAVVLEPGGFEGGSDGANGLDQLVHNYLLEGLVGQMHAAPAP